MKKKLFYLPLFLVTIIAFSSCGNDEINYEEAINTSYVKYMFKASDIFFSFYNVQIVYNTIDGVEKQVSSNDNNWVNDWKVKFSQKGDMKTIPVKYKIIATQKDNIPSLEDNMTKYDLSYEYGITWYSKSITVKSKHLKKEQVILKGDMKEWLNKNKTIIIVDYTSSPEP